MGDGPESARSRGYFYMGKILSKKAAESRSKTSYNNFDVSVYCPVFSIKNVTDLEAFEEKFKHLYEHVKIGRVYLECYRSAQWVDKEQLIRLKAYFEGKGIAVSGGITTDDDSHQEGFVSLCYSSEKGREILRKTVALNAEVFDEFIFDDFYFLNCRCEKCVELKGDRSWSEFRLDQKRDITENIVMKTAKEINPDVNVIVKFPQWYEVFNECGYDLEMEPALFDSIYTGTETRNPIYAQQHMPKYLSYFVMRYYESAAPGRNLGGWFDPYECTFNLSSYLEQGYLTLFAKAKEVALFNLASLAVDPTFQTFAPAVGQMFTEVDGYLGKLGNPIGAAAYRPHNARGEDNLHNYLGMCGIPMEPCITYPEDAKAIFLAEGAADDKDIIAKMKKSLLSGADVIVTSGFVRKTGEAFKEFANITYSSRKAIVDSYADAKYAGVSLRGKFQGDAPVMIPQMDYCTNDVWELAGAYATANNFPIVLRFAYGRGRVMVITVPDNMGDLYHYPPNVLGVIRKQFEKAAPVVLEGPAMVSMYAYDNDTMILRSDLEYYQDVTLHFADDVTAVKNIVTGRQMPVKDNQVTMELSPFVNYVLELVR